MVRLKRKIIILSILLLTLALSLMGCFIGGGDSNPMSLLNNPVVAALIIGLIVYWALKRKKE